MLNMKESVKGPERILAANLAPRTLGLSIQLSNHLCNLFFLNWPDPIFLKCND
jgi:hypothetical protein